MKELLNEAESFEKITFKLFDNVVSSPHTSGFFVESYDEIQRQKTDYHYNGARLTVSLDSKCTGELGLMDGFAGCSEDHPSAHQGQASRPGGGQ